MKRLNLLVQSSCCCAKKVNIVLQKEFQNAEKRRN